MLSMFVGALDQTIVGTAMPRIVSDLGGFSHTLDNDSLHHHLGDCVADYWKTNRYVRPQVFLHRRFDNFSP